MNGTLKLDIRFQSFWRVGTGAGLTGRVDMLTTRDENGLPLIPGRHLRGMLRQAVHEAEEFGWLQAGAEENLFGMRDVEEGNPDRNTAGRLRIETASLPPAEQQAILALKDEADFERIISGLYRTRRKTAIDPRNGTAKNHSLRVEEVVVPLTLEAEIYALKNDDDINWRGTISTALPLIRFMGGGRTRGLGRCSVTVADEQAGAAHG